MTNAMEGYEEGSEEVLEADEALEIPDEPEAPKVPDETQKPKRTPQEELEYFEGRAARLRKKLGTASEPEKETPAPKSSDELDYGKKAYLNSYGIKGADELSLVKSELKRSGVELDDLVGNEYFQGKLKDLRDAKATAQATPKGPRRSSQPAKDDLGIAVAEYKNSKTLPEDRKLREQVLDEVLRQAEDPFRR